MSSKDKDSEEIEKGAMDKKEKEEVSKEDNVTENKDAEKKDDQDVVFVQDVGFTVKIIAPNLEPFDIQVNKPSKNIPFTYSANLYDFKFCFSGVIHGTCSRDSSTVNGS